ncbi:GAF domain-containing protein [Corallococcus sp. CA047B]|uniref:sensor histidine kinase n=1 Tax=Corallococcus sp. CA047B TaxID=2316729 RepID=UPI000EA24E26|nr:GAF domain-containing protein [Corallococcus sp. CA047B]RKH19068.1 GAF domain-containing protein [Corallococcus sp. CA047B]
MPEPSLEPSAEPSGETPPVMEATNAVRLAEAGGVSGFARAPEPLDAAARVEVRNLSERVLEDSPPSRGPGEGNDSPEGRNQDVKVASANSLKDLDVASARDVSELRASRSSGPPELTASAVSTTDAADGVKDPPMGRTGAAPVLALPPEAGAPSHAFGEEGRFAFLARAGEVLSSSLDEPTVLRQLADLVVPGLADWCVVDLITPAGTVVRRAAAHRDPSLVPDAYAIAERWPLQVGGPTGVPHVLGTGQPYLLPDVPEAYVQAAVARGDGRLAEAWRLGCRSVMLVPLEARGRVLGCLSLMRGTSARRYGEQDLALAHELARRAALSLDNAALYGEARQAQARTARLQAVTAALSRAATEDAVAQVLAREVWEASGATRVAVLALEEDGGLRPLRLLGYSEDALARFLRPQDEDAFPRMLQDCRREAWWFSSQEEFLRQHPQAAGFARSQGPGARAVVPLWGETRVQGLLLLAWPEARAFSPSERSFLEALAHQCAQALERAALYEALRERTERLRQALVTGDMGTWRVDLGRAKETRDAALNHMLGLPAVDSSSAVGDFLSRLHAEDRPYVEAEFHRYQRQPPCFFELEFRVVRRDGGVRWLHSVGQSFPGPDGKVAYLTGAMADITRRKEAEERLQLLLDASRVLALRLDDVEQTLPEVAKLVANHVATGCRVDLASPDGTLRRVTAAHRASAHDARWKDTPSDRESGPTQPALQCFASGEVCFLSHLDAQRGDALSVHVDGVSPTSVLAVPLRARGRVLGVITLFTAVPQRALVAADVTMVEELALRIGVALENARLFHDAQSAVRLRDEFLSVASHELKTPLTSLILQHNLIGRALEVAGASGLVTGRLTTAQRQVLRLTALVDNLLDVSRLSLGKLALERTEVDLAQLTRDAVERLEEVFAQSRCPVRVDLPRTLTGQWDALRLDQVLVNLLTNAAKYGAGHPVSVRAGTGAEGEAWLEVRDEGIGIDAAALPRLFGRFERAVSDRHYGGMGLGLYISRQIVEALGGRIDVDSQPGQGATFTLRLPRHAAPDTQSRPPQDS